MAKITARGDREVARWKKDGAELVLTEQGRLLHKWAKGASWTLAGRNYDRERAADYAKARGYR